MDFSADPVVTRGSFAIPNPPFSTTEKVGTLPYMSPDVLFGRPYSYEADLYSLGVTMYQLLTGRYPFGHETAETEEEWLFASFTEYLVFQRDDKVSSACQAFIGLLTRRNYRDPVKIEDLLQHEFFAGV
ncbi:hypothetical protein H0H92_001759 [Tricholoma furcatifolium]|nr:hypothetical protein H0H92_001759 [Tricholoma furcatifolium]